MRNYKEHLVRNNSSVKEAMARLNDLATDAIVFVVDDQDKLVGSLTDGDVRRGLLKGIDIESSVVDFIQNQPKYLTKGIYAIQDVIELRKKDYKVIPVLNNKGQICNVINFRFNKSYLPVDAIIMAGGRGQRLAPMTDTVPKPLLKVGDQPIIEHNIDRLRKFGVDDYWISVRYLGEQLEAYLGDGSNRGINIQYVWEDEPLGTIGAASKIEQFFHDHVLITNSDILTTLNYEDFFLDFINSGADMSVITIPYSVDIPYAVMETDGNRVTSFKEKPTYTYYSNGGIYLVKREILQRIPKSSFYNSTDLMQSLIESGGKLVSYPMRQYWLDIGKKEDFEKAQADIKYLDLQ